MSLNILIVLSVAMDTRHYTYCPMHYYSYRVKNLLPRSTFTRIKLNGIDWVSTIICNVNKYKKKKPTSKNNLTQLKHIIKNYPFCYYK